MLHYQRQDIGELLAGTYRKPRTPPVGFRYLCAKFFQRARGQFYCIHPARALFLLPGFRYGKNRMTKAPQRPTAAILATLAILGRLLPHPPNFTPLGGAALFGGAKLGRPWNYILPLVVLLLTDRWLGFHNTMPYVYVGFIAMVWLGERASQNATVLKVGALSLTGSLLFFLLTNMGVWAVSGMYPPTLSGLVNCYVMAIPFFGATLLGDLVYSFGFFGLYALAEKQLFIQKVDNKLLGWLR